MGLIDRTPEIKALLKIGRREEAKARARAWADEVPQDYRAHLAAALAEVDFFNCSFVDVYFDTQKRKRFETGIGRAKMFANEEQRKEIDLQVGFFWDTLKEMEKFHSVAYSQILAQKDDMAANVDIFNRSVNLYKEKEKLGAEIKKLQDGVIFYEKELERLDNKLQTARQVYEYMENKGPAKGSFLTKKKREREYADNLTRQKVQCRALEDSIINNKAGAEECKAKIAQVSAVLNGVNDEWQKLNSVHKREQQKWETQENEAAKFATWGRGFINKLKAELGLLQAKRCELAREEEKLARMEDEMRRGAYKGSPGDASKARANISKLTQEISCLEKFLCKEAKTGGKTSVKKTDNYKTKRL